MKTGIIMKLQDGKATVMQSDCTFVTIAAKAGWKVGSTVSYRDKKWAMKYLASAAACLFVLLSLAGAGYRYYNEQVTLISIDTNPSIEIGVNRFDKVISIKGYNEEGKKLIHDIDVEKGSSADAIKAVMENEYFQSCVKKSKVIGLAVESDEPKRQKKIMQEFEHVDQYFPKSSKKKASKAFKPKVLSYSVDKELVEKAHALNMTPGKYAIYLEVKKKNPDIDMDDFLNDNIGDLYKIMRQKRPSYRPNLPNNNGDQTTAPAEESSSEDYEIETAPTEPSDSEVPSVPAEPTTSQQQT